MNLSAEIVNQKVELNQLAIFWLGQAGYLIKDSEGRRVAIDPYLSDCCMRLCNFKRLTPMLISAEELQADILCCSHDHPDHFDYDAMPAMMAAEKTQFVVVTHRKGTMERCDALYGVAMEEKGVSKMVSVQLSETA